MRNVRRRHRLRRAVIHTDVYSLGRTSDTEASRVESNRFRFPSPFLLRIQRIESMNENDGESEADHSTTSKYPRKAPLRPVERRRERHLLETR